MAVAMRLEIEFRNKCHNGIRFARSDDKSEVVMCMEWDNY